MDQSNDSAQPEERPSVDALLAADPGGMVDDELRRHVLAAHQALACVQAAVVEATGRFERRGLHRGDGARSAPSWLAARIDQTRGRCAADVRLARGLLDMPVVAAASRGGRLGRAKVDLLAEVRTPEVAHEFTELEATLVAEVERRDVAAAAAFLRCWHEQARLAAGWIDPDDPIPTDAPAASLDVATTFDGRVVLDGEMDAENGTIFRSALDAEVDELYRIGTYGPDDGLTPGERRGRALINLIARRALAGTKHDRPRPSIEVIVDERTLLGLPITDPATDGGADLMSRVRRTVEGLDIDDRTLRRLLCTADVHRLVINAEGEPLDVGKDSRTATRAQRRALRYRHKGLCGFPGCDAHFDWCEAHHIDPWDPDPTNDRGRTDLANLVPLCRFHHDQVHAGQFDLQLIDGRVVVRRPPDPRNGGQRKPITPTRHDPHGRAA